MSLKRLSVNIDVELFDALEAEAARRQMSKSAIVQEYVRERLGSGRPEPDPIEELIGSIDAEAGDIDEVVYG